MQRPVLIEENRTPTQKARGNLICNPAFHVGLLALATAILSTMQRAHVQPEALECIRSQCSSQSSCCTFLSHFGASGFAHSAALNQQEEVCIISPSIQEPGRSPSLLNPQPTQDRVWTGFLQNPLCFAENKAICESSQLLLCQLSNACEV